MLLYWIWFAQLKKLNCAQKRMLLQHFRDPEEVYHSDRSAFSKVEGITEDMLEALEETSLEEAQQILTDCTNKGIRIVTFQEKAYPNRLKNTYDPPMVLYCKGKIPDWEACPVIGIVGTRKATPYGMKTAYRFGTTVTACGALVVSGAAAGIDAMAMEGALAAGGSTVGVLGCGVDVVYPAKNRKLFEETAVRGCLISEYPPKTQADAWHFPQRNRIISGISNGLLVVEAPQKSGALISARHAHEQGREVFAVPGNVDEPACAGSNALLQDYAIAALSGWDVVKEYQGLYPGRLSQRELPVTESRPAMDQVQAPQKEAPDKKSIDKQKKSTYSVVNNPAPALNDQEKAVFEKLGREPITVDALMEATGLSAGRVKSILTKLTIKGLVKNHPGGRISLK